MSQLGKVASIHLFQTVWHAGLLNGNRRRFRVKDWASRVTWVRVARSIFAYRCGFLMCNRAKLWTPKGGGRWPEQKLPNCEVTQLPSWERTMKSPGFLMLHSLSQPEPEPRGCLSSAAYDTPCFMWRIRIRVKAEDIYFFAKSECEGTLADFLPTIFKRWQSCPSRGWLSELYDTKRK